MPPSAGNCVGCVGSRGNSDDATASAVIRGMTRVPAVDHRTNNFDFLRFVAASLVLYSHCFALTGMGGHEPLTRLTHGDYVFAGLAVRVFFVIRAYLVVALLGLVGAYRRRWLGTLAWLAMASLIFFWREVWGVEVEQDWPVINAFGCFVGGALVALYPETRRVLGAIAAIAAIAVVPTLGERFADVAIDALLVTGTLWFA